MIAPTNVGVSRGSCSPSLCCWIVFISLTFLRLSNAAATGEHRDAMLEREDLGSSSLFQPTSPSAEHLMRQLLCQCPGCQPKRISIRDCACGYAARQREEVLVVLANHDLTSAPHREVAMQAVLADQVRRYGGQVLVDPTTPTVWFLPLVAIFGCLAALGAAGQRWSRPALAVAVTPMGAEDDCLAERLDDELARVD